MCGPGWSVILLFACNNNRFSRDEAHFIMQHFVLVIVLPGFKVQWVLLYTPKNMYILNHKTIASFRTLSDTIHFISLRVNKVIVSDRCYITLYTHYTDTQVALPM